jgi:hypothetical protein
MIFAENIWRLVALVMIPVAFAERAARIKCNEVRDSLAAGARTQKPAEPGAP